MNSLLFIVGGIDLNAKKNIDNDEKYCPVEEKFSNVENDNNNINDKTVEEKEKSNINKKGDITNNMNIKINKYI